MIQLPYRGLQVRGRVKGNPGTKITGRTSTHARRRTRTVRGGGGCAVLCIGRDGQRRQQLQHRRQGEAQEEVLET